MKTRTFTRIAREKILPLGSMQNETEPGDNIILQELEEQLE